MKSSRKVRIVGAVVLDTKQPHHLDGMLPSVMNILEAVELYLCINIEMSFGVGWDNNFDEVGRPDD